MWKRKKKNKCSNRNEHKLPPANANGIDHSETQTPGPKLRKPYGRAGMSASACLCRRSKHKKNEYGVKMSIRANAGIMKDENEREQKYGNGRKRISAATGMSINFHQLTQTVLTIPKLKRPARSCASLTAGPACLHLPAYADVQNIKKMNMA